MNGVHDLGGMHGFGPVVREANEPVFHADWERRTFALALATMGAGRVNVDEFRRSIERMEPAHYLGSSYYEHWLHAIEAMLAEKGLLSEGEIDAAMLSDPIESARASPSVGSADADRGSWANPDAAAQPSSGVTLRRDPKYKARYIVGDRVLVRNLNPTTHTRVPRYVRGHRGVIRHDWGTFVFPDTHAHGAGAHPAHCYGVEFTARELWGTGYPASERVYLDLWEGYLETAAPASASEKTTLAQPVKRGSNLKPAALKMRAKITAKTTAKTPRVAPASAKSTQRGKTAGRAGSRKKR
jgi:nitrile hydratase beta subunit